MSAEPAKLPKPPTFLGGILYIFAGIVITGAGAGMTVILLSGRLPFYYPGAVWQTIAVAYLVLGAVVLGLGYRRMKRFFHTLPPDTETGETI